MSKILKLVKEHFSGDKYKPFDYRDFSNATGIDGKVAAMNLKRLAINQRLGSFMSGQSIYASTMYFYRTKEEINKAVDEVNAINEKNGFDRPLLGEIKLN